MPLFAIGWAGFVAIIFSAALFWTFRALKVTEFSPSLHLGCLFMRDPRSPMTETIGFFLLVVLGSTAIPLAYSRLFDLMGGASMAVGAGLGVVHGLLTAAALPLLGTISACVRSGAIEPPGKFGLKWGWLTPLAVVIGHGLYGAVCGAILANM